MLKYQFHIGLIFRKLSLSFRHLSQLSAKTIWHSSLFLATVSKSCPCVKYAQEGY